MLLLDEIDSLNGPPLNAVLSQLRAGYLVRERIRFPASVCLFGMRNIRDYQAASGGSPNQGTSSPFNISKKAVTLVCFTRDDIAALYGQHTAETCLSITSPGRPSRTPVALPRRVPRACPSRARAWHTQATPPSWA
ncbi:MAG: hypothetical protein FJ100_13760, partial [Deltaproteobacteria bacterium]|nr:hypothetical protein [Deltaproteobacteria bacterium]